MAVALASTVSSETAGGWATAGILTGAGLKRLPKHKREEEEVRSGTEKKKK